MKPRKLCEGVFYPENILLNFSNLYKIKIDQNIEIKIKKSWNKYKKKKISEGGIIWDATTYRLDFLDIMERDMELFLGEVKFSKRIGARDYLDEIFKLGNEFYPNGIFLSSIIQTSNNKYIIGEMSGKTISQSKFDLIGGVLSKDEKCIKTSNDIFNELLKELKEEVDINQSEVIDIYLRSIIQTEKMQVCFLFFVNINLNSQMVSDRFLSNNEILDIKFLEKKELMTFFEKAEGYKRIISTLV